MPDADPTSHLPLPQAQFHVLVALTAGDRHGYAIMQAVEESSRGIVRMGPATLYGTLKKLVDQGLAEEVTAAPAADDDQRRRYYRLTGLGRQVCVGEADRLAGLVRITRANLAPRGGLTMYRRFLVLYPRGFREEFGPDLLQLHQDLAADRGRAAARLRTALDLIVTVPRYRLEHLMNEQHSTTGLYLVILGLTLAGVFGFLTGIYPALIFVVAAAVVAVTQRSRLARAIRTPDTDVRHRRLRIAGICGAVFLASIVTYLWDLSDNDISTASLLLHNLIGTSAMFAAAGLLIAGLLTPRTPAKA